MPVRFLPDCDRHDRVMKSQRDDTEMTDSHTPSATEHLQKLAARGQHEPKLLTREEVIMLAAHVGKEHAGIEKDIAKKAEHNPEGVTADELRALCLHILGEKKVR
ncbi:hypothetical protein AA0243_1707 [Novacetimonas hansenii NRIC 0243]|nr:hypothetical protein AA0243_1707 [Novacetimonas hansenii NRIC 0243]